MNSPCLPIRMVDSVPRGFTRYYVLYLISQKPMTGNDIIQAAKQDSQLRWKPSPGLIYPLLGRLVAQGLAEEVDGKFQASEEGKRKLAQYLSFQRDMLERLSVFETLAEKITAASFLIADEVGSNVLEATKRAPGHELYTSLGATIKGIRKTYRDLLKKELQRVEKELGEENPGS